MRPRPGVREPFLCRHTFSGASNHPLAHHPVGFVETDLGEGVRAGREARLQEQDSELGCSLPCPAPQKGELCKIAQPLHRVTPPHAKLYTSPG